MPTPAMVHNMFSKNHDGIGFMINRLGKVLIVKGIKTEKEFWDKITKLNVNNDDALIIHFRWATQCNDVTMTQPFPYTDRNNLLKKQVVTTELGICHNGVIPATSNGNKEYSDTALFIRDYLYPFTQDYKDVFFDDVQNDIKVFTNSKWAFLDSDGNIATIGDFINDNGLLFSNSGYLDYSKYYNVKCKIL